MKRALVLSLLIALTTPAHALIQPPAKYDKAYVGGTTIIERPSVSAVTAECKRLGFRPKPGRGILGCALTRGSPKRCFVVIPDRAHIATLPLAQEIGPDTFRDILIRHERAHCNGFPADHRGGTVVTP